jgi:glycosyltransferase involved in cell wall biosynthesis
MVLAEAMAAGVPIVASSSGAIPEVTAGRARYFSPGDWVTLAEILREVLSTHERPDEHGVERYSLAATASRLAAAYAEVLNLGVASDRDVLSRS